MGFGKILPRRSGWRLSLTGSGGTWTVAWRAGVALLAVGAAAHFWPLGGRPAALRPDRAVLTPQAVAPNVQNRAMDGQGAMPLRPDGPPVPVPPAGPSAPVLPADQAPAPAPDVGGRPTPPPPAAPPDQQVDRFDWPVRGEVTAAFGWRYSETMGDWRWHAGIDIAAQPGAPVSAAAAGRVSAVRRTPEWAWEVIVDHGGGWVTRYADCASVRVAEGERVEAGQTIAWVGGAGMAELSSPPHLHFEILRAGRAVDPESRLD